MILYRHFESKSHLYRDVLDRACTHLADVVGTGPYDHSAVPALLRAAAADPSGFRLLFRHAAREPEFRDVIDTLRTASTQVAHDHITDVTNPGPWQQWAARLIPTLTLEAVITWLDTGQPDPDTAAERIQHTINAVIDAAQGATASNP